MFPAGIVRRFVCNGSSLFENIAKSVSNLQFAYLRHKIAPGARCLQICRKLHKINNRNRIFKPLEPFKKVMSLGKSFQNKDMSAKKLVFFFQKELWETF